MMNTKFINIFAAFLVLLMIGCGKEETPVTEAPANFFFKLQFVLGDVKIKGASGEVAANIGDQLKVSDVITTGKSAVADLVFGESGVIRIKENSKVTISSIADKAGSDTVMDMENGKVLLTLSKLKSTGFKVKTPTAVAGVRGTSFTVTSDKKGAKLSVVKGTVAVNPVKDGKVIENKTIAVQTGNTTDYIDKKSVERIIMGEMEIPVMEMTPAEKIEIQAAVKEMKIEEMPDMTLELKEDMKKETVVEPAVVEEKKDDTAEKAAQKKLADEKKRNEADMKKQQQEELVRQAEEQKKKEEELKRQAEEKKIKEEKVKKDRASNIPTM